MSGHQCDHQCSHSATDFTQDLDELDFEKSLCGRVSALNIQEVQRQLEKGNSPNVRDRFGYTPLHYAARSGSIDLVKLLLKYGAITNCQTSEGKSTPLHRAAFCGHLAIVELLVKNKANVLIQDSDGKTCLHKACENGHDSVAQFLLTTEPKLAQIVDNKNNLPQLKTKQ